MARPNNRKNLLEHGRRLVHSTSFATSSVQHIAEAAGVPKGSFYNHFKDKDAFGLSILTDYADITESELEASLVQSDMSPRDRLRTMFERCAEGFEGDNFTGGCLAGNLCQELASHNEGIQGAVDSLFRRWESLFEKCIAEGQQRGEIRDDLPAGELAELVLFSWEGALLRAKASHAARPLNIFRNAFLESIFT